MYILRGLEGQKGIILMSRKENRARNRKLFTFAWIAALTFLTVFLIYREMTAVLYILATLGVTALLVVVALADLSRHEKFVSESPHSADATASGVGLKSPNPTNRR